MTQTYTEDFQCQYMLQRYPFDTQAKTFILISMSSYSQACAIKMDRGSQSAETVLLSALKVFVGSSLSGFPAATNVQNSRSKWVGEPDQGKPPHSDNAV